MLLCTVAAVVGWSPVAWALRSLELAVLFFACMLLTTFVYLYGPRRWSGFATRTIYAPSRREFVLAAIGAMAGWAFYGSFLLLLCNLFLLMVSLGILPDWDVLTFSMVLGGIEVLLISWDSVATMIRQLYPSIAGIRSPYYAVTGLKSLFRGETKLFGLGWVALQALTAFFALQSEITRDIAVFALVQSLLYWPFASLWKRGTISALSMSDDQDVLYIAQLLRKLEYDVTISPSTGDATLDPLLLTVQLYAYSPKQEAKGVLSALVVGVAKDGASKDGASKEGVPWIAAAKLSAAAGILVLVDKTPAPSLEGFASSERFCLRIIKRAELRASLSSEDPAAEAEQLLRISQCVWSEDTTNGADTLIGHAP
jgi:hypothetical protein